LEVVSVWPFPPLIVAVIVYVPALVPVTVMGVLTIDFPDIEVDETELGLQETPEGQFIVIVKLVEESPALFTPIVNVVELPADMLDDVITDDAVKAAGDKTIKPVCSESDKPP